MAVNTSNFNDRSWIEVSETTLSTHTGGLFNFWVASAGKSPETQRKYADWLKLFYQDVVGAPLEDLAAIPIAPFMAAVTPAAVEAWMGMYAAKGHSKSGLGQARATIVFFARMLVLSRQAPSSLWHDLKLVSLPDHAASAAYGESTSRHGARWLSPQEVRLLMDAAKRHPNPARGKRDFALLWLMVTLGLRRDELAGLLWENLTRRGKDWALRIRGKRNKWRAVVVPPETLEALEPWAKTITGGASGMPPGYMMRRISRAHNPLPEKITGNAVWRIVAETWAQTGMEGHLAPHDLRRTAAAALEGGASDREIQQILGHSSIETTHRYLAPMRENTATYRIAELLKQADTPWG
jgi:integrase